MKQNCCRYLEDDKRAEIARGPKVKESRRSGLLLTAWHRWANSLLGGESVLKKTSLGGSLQKKSKSAKGGKTNENEAIVETKGCRGLKTFIYAKETDRQQIVAQAKRREKKPSRRYSATDLKNQGANP